MVFSFFKSWKQKQADSARRKKAEKIAASGDLPALLALFDLESWSPSIEAFKLPSVRLLADNRSTSSGRSRLGGNPELPEGVAWPLLPDGRPMAFIAQIDLKQLDGLTLPMPKAEGMLYFFYDCFDCPWGFSPGDRGHWKVIYLTDQPGVPAQFPAKLPSDHQFEQCALQFSQEMSFPDWDALEIESLGMSKDELDRYVELKYSWLGKGADHRMFGHPDTIQGEMQWECELVSNGIDVGSDEVYKTDGDLTQKQAAQTWRLLLQVDSDDNMMWGDAGMIYYWIRQEDLDAMNFDNVWLVLQCY